MTLRKVFALTLVCFLAALGSISQVSASSFSQVSAAPIGKPSKPTLFADRNEVFEGEGIKFTFSYDQANSDVVNLVFWGGPTINVKNAKGSHVVNINFYPTNNSGVVTSRSVLLRTSNKYGVSESDSVIFKVKSKN